MPRIVHIPTRLACGAAAVLLAALAACGGDDDTVDDAGPSDVTSAVTTEPATDGDAGDEDGGSAATAPADDGSDSASGDAGDDAATPPAEDSGTITVAGTTTELGPDDFGICETVNPAFAEAFNIVTQLDDGTAVRLNGDLGDMDPELDGFFLGEIPAEEQATDLELERDGRTISGTASVAAGAVEFSFTC